MTKLKKIVVALLLIGAMVALYFVRFSPSARREASLKRGEQYFQAKEYDKAKFEFMNVVRTDSRNTLAVDRMASIWVAQGAPTQAIPFMMRLKELQPDNLANLVNLAQAFLALGDFKSAGKEAAAVLDKDPNSEAGWVAFADAVITKEQVDRLEKGVGKLQSPNPGQDYAAAVLSIRNRDLLVAEQKFAKAAKAAPDFARAHIRLAEIRGIMSDPAGVAKELEKAYAAAPARSLEKLRYPEFLSQNGKAAEARGIVNDILKEAPDFMPASLMLGAIANREKNYPEALKVLETVFQRDPNNFQGRILQAQVQIAQNDYPAAIDNLERLEKVFPSAGMVPFELGRAYALAGRLPDAVASLRRAVGLNPAAVEAKLLLAELEFRNGQPQAALDVVEDLLAQRKDLFPAQRIQAAALRALKRYDEAAAILRKHTELTPNRAESWIQLGTVLRDQRKFSEARAAFEQALKLEPQQLATVNSLVELDLATQNYTEASARLAALDEKTRGSAEVRVIEARIQGAQKKWPEAEASLLKAIELNAELEVAYQLLIALYFENKRFDDAIARLEEKVAKKPDDSSSRVLLAGLYERKKEFAKARAVYEQILGKRADSFVALNNLAYLLSEQFGELARAEGLARKARAQNADNPMASDTLGWILYKKGNFDESLTVMRETLTRLSELEVRGEVPAEIYFHLGMVNAAMGNTDQAKAAFAKAEASKTEFPSKAELPERLALLKPSADGGVPVERLQALAKDKPNDPVVQLRFAEALDAQGKEAEAIAAYEQALKANPKLAQPAVALARLHVQSNPAKAVEFAKLARTLAPSDAAAAARLGVTIARLGDANWAYSLLQQGTVQTGAAPADLLEFAKVAYRLGKANEAKQALDRAIAGNPPADTATAVRANLRMMDLAGQAAVPDDAAGEIAAVLKDDPKNLAAMMAEAAALNGKKDFKGAVTKYEAVLAAYPNFPLAQARLAAAMLEAGDSWEKAHTLAEACRTAVPNDPTATLVLGETFYRKKEYSRSVDLLLEASRAKPLDAKRLFLLGSDYFELKNKTRSEEFLNKAKAAGLDGPDLEKAEAMLKKLKE